VVDPHTHIDIRSFRSSAHPSEHKYWFLNPFALIAAHDH